ncbi:zinc finger protein 585B-like isoform X2 [Pseudomyrmex gracilis]|uniref:zinc finger protein 585B-like isoform X2 n=1 Tax=Pseudomyrmex gracilis TaxID=219809 RepID=UPI0009957E37|nr:zinc finger protein 585B-like isoform X2 [Pseudomyrmex gracilis]
MNEDVVEIENVENVCRLCLSADEPRSSVFSAQEQEDDSDVLLVDKIEDCLSIQILATDKVSTLICKTCVKSVNQWHTYKESCLRSQNKLQEWLAKQHSNPMVITIKDEPMDVDNDENIEIISEVINNSEQISPTDVQMVEDDGKETDNKEVQKVTDNSDTNNDNKQEDTVDGTVSVRESVDETVPSTVEETDKDESKADPKDSIALCSIKTEPPDDDDADCIDLDSLNDRELMNSLASKDDTVMEADSTQKSNAARISPKKKMRRGPHTHYRGMRTFKQKCPFCKIFLHSKQTYVNHMKKFHSERNDISNSNSVSQNEEEEMVEDLEDELASMEQESPLTPVQQEIISQLKTFSCYSCNQTFNDRRSTLFHIRQHLPDLRPHTCIACLTEFPDRPLYQSHCGASFECAMKIALVVPTRGHERYFTCNMCLRSLQSRKELLSHLSKHSDKQYEEMMSPTRSPPKLKPMAPLPSAKSSSDKPQKSGPYKNGDPAHNHICDLCGMIYRYRPNLFKHKEYCKLLDPETRMTYKCVHCLMTFLVFKKFHSHITVDHKKKEFTCFVCNSKFRSPSDFLTHHEKHRGTKKHDGASQSTGQFPLKERNAHEADPQSYTCALCNQEFSTRSELSKHRSIHLKVKIYSCVICHSMFSSIGALEIHMKDHGIDDPDERNANISCVEYGNLDEDMRIEKDVANTSSVSDPGTQVHKCCECGKIMNTYANLRRHAKIAHRNATIFECIDCSRMFTRKEVYDQHMQLKHKNTKTMLQCPQCPKSFVFQSNFAYHFRTAHLEKSENGYACNICGKVFEEEASLKIHKGWHNRANSRLSTQHILGNPNSSKDSGESSDNAERPARARKSFPNPPLQSLTKASNFECQVCNDQFNSVAELRSHLWEVHCARSKTEKSFTNNELQCELCTNIFPDRETLASHMQWHKANPILSEVGKTFTCDVCGKHYSSKKVLWKHKRLHKSTVVASMKFQSLARKPMASQFMCTYCRKVFSSSQSLQRHKLSFHAHESHNQQRVQQPVHKGRKISINSEDETRAKIPRLDIDSENPSSRLPSFSTDFVGEKKKSFMCHLCKKVFPNMSVLYKHKQSVHKPRASKDHLPEFIPTTTKDGKYSCNVCYKKFPGLSNLRQHFTIKHKKISSLVVSDQPRNHEVTSNNVTHKTYESTHNYMIYSCKLCKQCHVFNKDSIVSHINNVHNTVYEADSKMFHRETNLNTYVVKGAIGSTCPHCNVKYPNNKALKIHYIRYHEDAD